MSDKDGVWYTVKACPYICSEVGDWAYKVFVPHKDVRHEEAKGDGADPGAHETFDCLLRRDLDELRAAEGNTTDVSENVIGDDQRAGQKHPDHALKDIIHHEMSLNHDEVQRHMGPSKLSKLKLVVTFLQRADKEDETENVHHKADKSVMCGEG